MKRKTKKPVVVEQEDHLKKSVTFVLPQAAAEPVHEERVRPKSGEGDKEATVKIPAGSENDLSTLIKSGCTLVKIAVAENERLRTLIKSGCTLYKKGKFEEARILYNQASDVASEIYGKDHPIVKDCARMTEISAMRAKADPATDDFEPPTVELEVEELQPQAIATVEQRDQQPELRDSQQQRKNEPKLYEASEQLVKALTVDNIFVMFNELLQEAKTKRPSLSSKRE